MARLVLGVRLKDVTSGFEGFHREVVGRLLRYPFRSRAHFFQTEVRYLLRNSRWMEVPIHYRAPSPKVSEGSIRNSICTLLYYALLRLRGVGPEI